MMHSWEALCWCGHSWDYHLTQLDKRNNNCEKCKCKDYRENSIARFIKLDGLGIGLALSVGVFIFFAFLSLTVR